MVASDNFFNEENYDKASHLFPLEEKIHMFFKDEIAFNAEDVANKFPNENMRAIYRALNKLEETNRIQHLRWVNRKKVYTAAGQSNLPMLKFATGSVAPVSVLVNNIPGLFGPDGRVKNDEIDRLYILMCQLFVIALQDDPKRDFLELHKELIEIRSFLLRSVENIDAIIRHPAMQGNMEVFKRSFATGTDPALPKPEELLEFRRWLAKLGEK